MFDIGWSEMLVIAVVLIVVVGPKDLPRMLRTFGKMTSKMTSMAGDFRKQFDEALREADLDDVKKTIDSARRLNPTAEIKRALNPMEQAAKDVRAGLDTMMKPKPVDLPKADDPAVPAEPAKVGAVAMPGETPVELTPAATTAKSAEQPVTAAVVSKSEPPQKATPKPAPVAKKTAAQKPAAQKPANTKPETKKPAKSAKAAT